MLVKAKIYYIHITYKTYRAENLISVNNINMKNEIFVEIDPGLLGLCG